MQTSAIISTNIGISLSTKYIYNIFKSNFKAPQGKHFREFSPNGIVPKNGYLALFTNSERSFHIFKQKFSFSYRNKETAQHGRQQKLLYNLVYTFNENNHCQIITFIYNSHKDVKKKWFRKNTTIKSFVFHKTNDIKN